MFISFEGPEGCGKTSQIVQLAEHLSLAGFDVVNTREPGGTPIGDRIRDVLLDLSNTNMHNRTEILLFQASRAQLVEQVIRPHLVKGGVVLCDRYADSTLAYQGYGYETDLELLRAIVNFATGNLIPDLTLLLDLRVEIGLQRRAGGGSWNRLDALELAFYERVRLGYHKLAQIDPNRWVIINAEQPPEQVQMDIREVVSRRLAAQGR
jgi:dTMP kinase